MTNQQALKAMIAFPVSGEVIELALIRASLEPAGTFTLAENEKLNQAAISVLTHVKQLKSLTEADLTYQISETAIDKQIAEIRGIVEEEPQGPEINDLTSAW